MRTVMAVCLVVLAACGGGSGGSTATKTPDALGNCQQLMGNFVQKVEDLDARLDIGLTITDYRTQIGDINVAMSHEGAVAPKLTDTCRTKVLEPATKAFSEYEVAYQQWNRCTYPCTFATIKSKIQAKWARAHSYLMSVKAVLNP